METETKHVHLLIAKILAEFGGTAVLLFIGCLGCLHNYFPYQAAVSFGMGLITAIQIFGHISGGHFNPAVTVAAVIHQVITITVGLIYIVAQLVGATVGYLLAMILAPEEYGTREDGTIFCNTIPNLDTLESFFVEFICTFLLALLCCSTWDPRNQEKLDSVAIKLGLFIFAIVQVTGPMTGASLNPARTFGPSVVNNNWDTHWLYWVAPILGAAIASVFYKYVFAVKRSTRNA